MTDQDSSSSAGNQADIANRLHSVAIHLLRRARQEDLLTGLAPARLSALSVIGFGGPCTVTDLAEAEQVAVPTISRIVAALVAQRLVERQENAHDRRTIHLVATPKGMDVLREGRRRRTAQLGTMLAQFTTVEQATIAEAVTLMERMLHSASEE
ncbi:MarR family winged helix-turn-helix transcriptional regulator [Ktedonobacter racemifer]|uniref:Transcriptional regulator, MarR family n=1 Tax=Ktedonobacter racemifer DSM 44963 TaxID=485913 RepID=D6TW47_KTERA|nr:MarR family transcriptional regulator [Ktedonobacter racemifer]EFH84430.1 transcriptional regulator, MarR family [Ktedonobacter racemifer DSM 44963]